MGDAGWTKDGEIVVIDVGQAMTNDFFNAKELLDRDIININRFFKNRGADIFDPETIKEEVFAPADEEDDEDSEDYDEEFDDEEEFEEFLDEVEADLEAENQERSSKGLETLGKPAGAAPGKFGKKETEEEVLTDDEVKALAHG